MTIQASDIPDIVVTTRKEEGALRFQQIAQSLPFYEVFSRIFKRDKVTFQSGRAISRTLMTKLHRAAADHVGFLEPDVVDIIDVLETMTVEWVHARTYWGLVYQTDVLMNSGPELILNIIKPRRLASVLGLVEELEDAFWADAPASSNKTEPWGIKYWLVSNATAGFNGGAPSGHSTVGGINPTTTPAFKNYTLSYGAVSFMDLIKKLKTAFRACRFVSPVQHPDYRNQIRDRYRGYVNEVTISLMEDLIRAQNSDLGKDLAAMEGQAYINGYPIIQVPKLDADTTNPIYFPDFATFYPVCLKGDYLRETGPIMSKDQHNAWNNFVDLTYNFICIDRRRNIRGYEA